MMVTFGVGWLEREFELIGVPFHDRGRMADEYLAAIDALHEAGVRLCFDTVPVAGRTPVSELVRRVLGPWRELGMDPAALLGTVLAPSARISELTPPHLPDALRRVTHLGGALTEACNEG